MEQAQCWMWTKLKHNQESPIKPLNEDVSWEEQAFAEDAAGNLGGCIWPPRSYSCSFCRREFKSAQALGGHMNVHRRDRARLKHQSTSPHSELLQHHPNQNNHNFVQYPCTSFGLQYPSSQVCALAFNPNPNSDFNSRVSAPPTKENSREITLVVPSSSMVQGHHKLKFPFSSPRSWSNFDQSGCRAKNPPDLSVSLNLVVCRKRSTLSDEEDSSINSKRKRIDASPLPLFEKSSSSKVLELSPRSLELEDLDLELRLGDRPMVK